jgi:predicted MFS family arabinose efflux permease
MTEKIHKVLSDSKAARWTALGLVAFLMFCGYFVTDVMAPLKGLLEGQLHWNSVDYGVFTSAYGWFNVFLLMLIFGGIILDKMGVRFTGLMAAAIMFIGVCIKYWAISTHSLDGQVWKVIVWDVNAQVLMAGLGYAIFGVGIEIAGITVSKTIVKWFMGKEMALAMGLEMAVARIGTGLALGTALPIANAFNDVSKPVLLGVVMVIIGLISFIVYTFMDRKLEASVTAVGLQNNVVEEEEESFKISDIFSILGNKGWWLIALLCLLFYSAVFPFLKYAADLMVQKFDINPNLAGAIPSMLPFGTIILTPLFGNLYDRKGKGASIMILGSLILVLVHLLFAVPFFNSWLFAIVLTIVLGIGFALVPSAMWPSVPKIIPQNQLGTAYALIFWVQNIGLMGVPALIGWILNTYCITGTRVINGITLTTYNYTLPMLTFASFGVLAVVLAFMLKREDAKKGYGLELPNIKK